MSARLEGPIGSWKEMRLQIESRLERQTDHNVRWWNDEIARIPGLDTEAALRAFLAERGVTGYQQMLLVFERFGYPAYLVATADELVEAQYRDRASLWPIFEAVIATASSFGSVELQARKTYITLRTPRRTFAAVRPTTKTRADLALRLGGVAPQGRLQDGSTTAGGGLNLRIALEKVEDLDDEVIGYLRRAYEESLPVDRK